jgi:hypothetical protein
MVGEIMTSGGADKHVFRVLCISNNSSDIFQSDPSLFEKHFDLRIDY